MTHGYNKDYAPYYDLLYKEKDYARECDYLEQIWKKYIDKESNNILDLGCGTGGHSIELAERDYKVTGVDLSESMIRIAKDKAALKGLDVKFQVSPMQEIDFDEKWDVTICMFNAVNYLIGSELVKKTFSNIRRSMSKDGLFLFDYRNGIPSIRSFSPTRVKWVNNENEKILRISENTLNAITQQFNTNYTIIVFNSGKSPDIYYDKHIMQYFFPLEIEQYLNETGFQILSTHPFLEMDRTPSEEDWNIMVVAKAI